MTYTIIQSEHESIGGIWEIPSDKKAEIPPHWMAYILVDDIEKTMKEAESAGATIKVPVTQVSDMGRFIVIMDPTGAHIAFWETI